MARKPPEPPVALDEYVELRPLLRHVRVMEAVMSAIDEDPKLREFCDDVRAIYDTALHAELAPHALLLALALIQEDAFPQLTQVQE